jgi:hypothetical protein
MGTSVVSAKLREKREWAEVVVIVDAPEAHVAVILVLLDVEKAGLFQSNLEFNR